jgi:ribosome-binding factor A
MHLIQRRLKDPRVQGVTVTEVRASPDLSHATVFLRSEAPVEMEDAIAGLESASGYLRRSLGQSLRIRKVPEFRFLADNSLERAARIEELLRLVRNEGVEEAGEE